MPVRPSASVWVVDDDCSARRSIRRLLETEGYHVEAFASGEEFLRRGDGTQCDCLVLDVWMFGMTGLELHESLLAAGCSTPVVFITANNTPEVQRRATEQRAVALLEKPFASQVLLDAVAATLATPNDDVAR